jgi:trehalose/maltose hydrolase-like predicted phosphorylase
MARWNIRRALEVAALLRERWPDRWARLSYRLGLEDTELVRWRTVAETMFTGWNSQTGLFEQFAGLRPELADLPPRGARRMSANSHATTATPCCLRPDTCCVYSWRAGSGCLRAAVNTFY